MQKSQYTEEHIAYTRHEAEMGTPVAELCPKRGKSQAQAVGCRPLARQAYAPEGNQKKAVRPTQKRELVQFLRVGFKVSERRACQAVGIGRSSHRYHSIAKDQTALRMRIRDLAAARVRYGYRRVHVLLGREGWKVNHKRVYRLYRREGLSLRLKTRKKRVSAPRNVQPAPTAPNQRWSMDFMSDRLYDGRRFRVVPFVDTMTRERPHYGDERSFSGRRIAEIRDQVGQRSGLPEAI